MLRISSFTLSQKVGRFNAQFSCKPIYDVNARAIHAALQRADVGAIELSPMRQLFLGQLLGLPQLPQVGCKHVPYIHDMEERGLQSI